MVIAVGSVTDIATAVTGCVPVLSDSSVSNLVAYSGLVLVYLCPILFNDIRFWFLFDRASLRNDKLFSRVVPKLQNCHFPPFVTKMLTRAYSKDKVVFYCLVYLFIVLRYLQNNNNF